MRAAGAGQSRALAENGEAFASRRTWRGTEVAGASVRVPRPGPVLHQGRPAFSQDGAETPLQSLPTKNELARLVGQRRQARRLRSHNQPSATVRFGSVAVAQKVPPIGPSQDGESRLLGRVERRLPYLSSTLRQCRKRPPRYQIPSVEHSARSSFGYPVKSGSLSQAPRPTTALA